MSDPAISIVIPTFDRAERLRDCLAAIGRLEHKAEGIEIVVADDGGRVDPEEARLASAGHLVHVVRAGGGGPAAARNAGARAATAELIGFTDDDCEPDPGWAEALLRCHRSQPGALIGGTTINGLDSNPYSRTAQGIADAAIAHHNGGPAGPRFFPSSNVAIPAARFREIGGFDEELRLPGGEDRDLCERWSEHGWPLIAEPTAIVRHSHDLDLRTFWRQQAAYGAGAFRHRRGRAERGGELKLEPSLTSGVLSAAARQAVAERDPVRLALLGVWQAANLRGFIGATIRERRRSTP